MKSLILGCTLALAALIALPANAALFASAVNPDGTARLELYDTPGACSDGSEAALFYIIGAEETQVDTGCWAVTAWDEVEDVGTVTVNYDILGESFDYPTSIFVFPELEEGI